MLSVTACQSPSRSRRQESSVSQTTFGYIGILSDHKGIRLLVDAFKKLAKSRTGDKVRLLVVGTGPLHGDVSKELASLGQGFRLEMLGWVENERIPSILQEIDCLVLPSIYPENQPVSIMEGLAAGVPAIASNSGGVPEIVENGDNGYLFQSGNALSLLQCLLDFLDLPRDRRRKMAENCIKFAAEHQDTRVATEYLDRFQRIAAQQSSAKPRSKHVWLDVSIFLSNTRTVGITRPILELLKRREFLPDVFRFYCFADGTIREVLGGEIEARMSAYEDQRDVMLEPSGSNSTELKRRQESRRIRIIGLLRTVKYLLNLVPFARKPARHIEIVVKTIINRRRQISNAGDREDFGKTSPFEEGDTVLILCYDPSIHYFATVDFFKLEIISYVYDLIPIRLPFLYKRKPGWSNENFERHIKYLEAISSRIWTISEYTRADLISHAKTSGSVKPLDDKISVLHLGAEIGSGASLKKTPNNYILYVGTIEPRKNHRMICGAYVMMLERDLNPPECVFVGKVDPEYQGIVDEVLLDSRLRGRITYREKATDEELSALYKGSLFTIYPSIAEGWGFPVVESLSHGRFVLCSSTTSMTEAGKSFCEYIHPYDAAKWAERILYYSEHRDMLRAKEQEIGERYVKRSWRDFLEDVVAKSNGEMANYTK